MAYRAVSESPAYPSPAKRFSPVLPEGEVRVHAAAVVVEERLGHERHRLAVLAGHVLDHVLVLEQLVRHLDQRAEAHVDLRLAAGRHLVVLRLDRDADLLEGQHHLAADVLLAVRRRNREVAFLVARLVAEVRAFHAARVPAPLDRIDVVVAFVLVLVEADVVEDEELRLRPEVGGVGDAQALQVVLRLAGDVPRIPGVVLARDRVADVADQDQGLCRPGRDR